MCCISSDIDSSILDSIDVQELEYLLKLNIQKGKAFSTLAQSMDGLNAYQSALDVSMNMFGMSVPSITFRLLGCPHAVPISQHRYFTTPRVRRTATSIGVLPSLYLVDCLWCSRWGPCNKIANPAMRKTFANSL